jgi:hypothetical protein
LFRRLVLRLLLSFVFRQAQTAFTGNEQNFIHLGEGWVAGIDLLATLNRRHISLFQLEIMSRDFKIVQRVLLKISVAHE